MARIIPKVLIVSNRYDFSADYVCAILMNREIDYLRLNSDDLTQANILMKPLQREVYVQLGNNEYVLSNSTLHSVYFRAPTYLRETSIYEMTYQEKFSRTQWAAFIRSLQIFNSVKWVNSPQATYLAENKPAQLATAQDVGFLVPETLVSNSAQWTELPWKDTDKIIAKGIDTVYLRLDNQYAFTYTNTVTIQEIRNAELASAPVMFQKLLDPKIDIRVTVVDEMVFSVSILQGTQGVKGDWRLMKDNVSYSEILLPKDVQCLCISIVKKLGLVFGAIDLVYVDGNYYFIPDFDGFVLFELTRIIEKALPVRLR